jgi:cob(I)alamin adenosyltransferase
MAGSDGRHFGWNVSRWATLSPHGTLRAQMKIYTRKGDDGTTSLWYGGRVTKSDARTEAYGSLDEAASALGVARSLASDERVRGDILHLQDDLFVAGAELATAPEARGRLEGGVSRLEAGMVAWLEEAIDGYMAAVNLPPKFVIPGGTQLSAQLDVARSVLRRAERRIVALAESDDLGDSVVITYVNRASDMLFAMARFTDVPAPELFEGRGRSSADAT